MAICSAAITFHERLVSNLDSLRYPKQNLYSTDSFIHKSQNNGRVSYFAFRKALSQDDNLNSTRYSQVEVIPSFLANKRIVNLYDAIIQIPLMISELGASMLLTPIFITIGIIELIAALVFLSMSLKSCLRSEELSNTSLKTAKNLGVGGLYAIINNGISQGVSMPIKIVFERMSMLFIDIKGVISDPDLPEKLRARNLSIDITLTPESLKTEFKPKAARFEPLLA